MGVRRMGWCRGPASAPSVTEGFGGRAVVTPVSPMVRSGLVRTHADARQLAHPSLARAHGERGVALQRFDMVEAFLDAAAKIGGADVVAEADECALVSDT